MPWKVSPSMENIMNRKNILLGLLVLLIVVVGCNPTPAPPDTACDPNGCISISKLSANISNTLNNHVVGFVSIVNGVLAFGGQARTVNDPPYAAMLPGYPSNVASVSKVLTTIGVLQSLAKHNLTIDDKISPYLWTNWKQGPNINTITFRDLLTHKAGFRVNCNGSNTTYAVLQQQIVDGVNLSDKAVASYNNCNFAIFRELLPFMEGNTYSGQNTDNARASWSANFYISYMNQHVFQPVGISTRACKPPTDTSYVVLSYPFPAGSTHGNDWGDWTLSCGGGGWVLSANDLYAVVNDLANGNGLLTSDEKNLMNSNCLGWDCSVRNDCPDPYVCKNGSLDSGSITLWTYLGILKCNVPVAVIVNSQTPASEDVIDVVTNAYNSAGVAGSPAPCPIASSGGLRRVPLSQVEQTSTPLPRVLQPRLPIETQPAVTRTLTPVPRSTQAPRPPILVSPIDGTVVECGRVNLTWKPAEDPSGIRDYDVELEKLVDPSYVSEKTWNNIRSDSTPFDASCGTRYRWRVRATDNAGKQSDWSAYGYFRILESVTARSTPTRTPLPRDTQAPRPPIQVAPIDGATLSCGQVTLTWRPATDPSGIHDYDVELQKLVDRTYVAEKTWNNVRGNSITLDQSCNTQYRWRVRATDNVGNQGVWSEYQDFDVQSQIQ